MRSLMTAFLLTVTILALASAAVAAGPAPAKLLAFDVTRMSLETPLVRQETSGTTATYSEVYLVRLRGEFPNRNAQVMELYVGDKKIDEYGELPGGAGLYFILTAGNDLDALAGGEFAYRFGEMPKKSLGLKFSAEKMGPKAISEKTAFKRPWGK